MQSQLISMLQKDNVTIDASVPIRIAQYNSPQQLTHRTNEIWIPVSM